MTDHRIELAREADLPRILELSNWAAEHTAANFATQPEPLAQWVEAWRETAAAHPWLVARGEGGEVAGFAKSSPHRSRAAYNWSVELSVYIDPQWHGRGLGRALYDVLIPLLRAQGYMTALAGIVGGHEASERLHAKAGFVRCATFHCMGWKFDRWHDVGYWELQLQPLGEAPRPIRPVAEVAPPALQPQSGHDGNE